MLVADMNVVFPLLRGGDGSETAAALLAADPDWRLPSLWHYELANVLRNQVKHGVMTRERAAEIALRAEELLASGEEHVSVQDALVVAVELGLSGYDAAYVVLAERLGCALVTLDEEVLKRAPGVARGLG